MKFDAWVLVLIKLESKYNIRYDFGLYKIRSEFKENISKIYFYEEKSTSKHNHLLYKIYITNKIYGFIETNIN